VIINNKILEAETKLMQIADALGLLCPAFGLNKWR
jgi:hypothetical protein